MVWSLDDIARWTGGRIAGGEYRGMLSEVSVDSRELIGSDALFVALDGPRFDGHDFVDEAAAKGAKAALIHRPEMAKNDGDMAYVVVDDTLEALQAMAARWRQRFSIPVIGVTGSNGKTIVKDMLASIAGRQQSVHRSPGSYNSQVGVALALLGIRDEHDLAIIEAGISEVGEMETLQEMIRPTCGIITNIGLAHAAGLVDEATTAREKMKLFAETSGPVVVPGDEPLLSEQAFHVKRIPYCADGEQRELSEQCSVVAGDVKRIDDGFRFQVVCEGGRNVEVVLNVPGRHNVANATCAAALADWLGIDDSAIANGLGAYSLSKMRLEMHTTGAGITLINDAYNADPMSVRAALRVLDNYSGGQRQIAILGDMLDLGTRTERAHRQIGALIERLGVDRLFCIGARARYIADGARNAGFDDERLRCVDDFDRLHRVLDDELSSGDVLLFKASRSVGLERAARRLIESVAPTRMYIDLEAIADNFHALRRHLGDDVDVLAVVKSFGYGNNSTRISQTLVQEGVDALAVAYPDEAIPLRRRGLSVPILVMNARAAEADKLVKYDLQPLVYRREVVDALARQARRRDTSLGVHLAVDTGMRRAGLRPDQVVDFEASIAHYDRIDIAGVMTHFAAADDPREDAFTQRQIEAFEGVVDGLEARGVEPPVIHAANTAAAWRFPEARFDMVRVGLGLYGIHPSPHVETTSSSAVRPALRMTTRVLHLHVVEQGETVGYGRSWTAPGRRQLATLAAGYNDGYPYFLSNCGEVLINGRRCPVVGSVCMDVTVVDVTDAGDVDIGDEAVLFGRQQQERIDIDEWTADGETINYELLCNISPRVRRIFLK